MIYLKDAKGIFIIIIEIACLGGVYAANAQQIASANRSESSASHFGEVMATKRVATGSGGVSSWTAGQESFNSYVQRNGVWVAGGTVNATDRPTTAPFRMNAFQPSGLSEHSSSTPKLISKHVTMTLSTEHVSRSFRELQLNKKASGEHYMTRYSGNRHLSFGLQSGRSLQGRRIGVENPLQTPGIIPKANEYSRTRETATRPSLSGTPTTRVVGKEIDALPDLTEQQVRQ